MTDRLVEIEAYYEDMPDQSMVKWLIEEVKWLRRVAEAGYRLKLGYMDWYGAGGPNQCPHGRAEGIPCPHCDLELVMKFGQCQT